MAKSIRMTVTKVIEVTILMNDPDDDSSLESRAAVAAACSADSQDWSYGVTVAPAR